MILLLESGYPHPLPKGFDFNFHNSKSHHLEIKDVIHFEWLHTVTVQFKTREACLLAKEQTGWNIYNPLRLILEAPTSDDDGWDSHNSIVVPNLNSQFNGFILMEDQTT